MKIHAQALSLSLDEHLLSDINGIHDARSLVLLMIIGVE